VNSEELEKSLRTEFDGYLKGVLADMRQEVVGLQNKIEAEFEKHKSQIDAMFQDFSVRMENDRTVDEGFKESIVEHLRLARDEGARITAEAITEAEQMREAAAPAADFSEMRDAINDISSKDSQAEILKALVNHAARYTPRGAFFIVKNDHFVGWRVFGTEAHEDEQSVREVFFSVNSPTVLSESIRNLKTTEGAFGQYNDEAIYLNKLNFGKPDRMYAIPLVARGRGVAVLYADYGQEGTRVDIEALETLVRVAGLTVELLAASRGGKQPAEAKPQPAFTERAAAPAAPQQQDYFTEKSQNVSSYQTGRQEAFAPALKPQVEAHDYQQAESFRAEEDKSFDFSYQPAAEQEDASAGQEFQSEQSYQPRQSYQEEQTNFVADGFSTTREEETGAQNEYGSVYEDASSSWNQSAPESFENYKTDFSTSQFSSPQEVETPGFETQSPENDYSLPAAENFAPPADDYQIDSQPAFESPETPQFNDYSNQQPESSQFDSSQFGTNGSYNQPPVNDYSSPANSFDSSSYQTGQPSFNEPAVKPAAPVKTRFSERNTDLPIEVNDDERRLHNDARRFARLLVSEIKLYNEQKVNEGRESRDLYERLREAIDRSREMYDKRVQPPVASKFDYFHYELVNTLAEGDESRLGSSYPGAEV
jgi:hypothetical protein